MQTKVLIGQIIRKARVKKNLTQLDAARKLGYDSTQFVSLFERGLSKCPVSTLGRLCRILDIPKHRIVSILVGSYAADVRREMGVL